MYKLKFMIYDFNLLPQNAKIWIYQANRTLEANEIDSIESFLTKNIDIWASHGSALTGAFKIFNDRFIVIGCDLSFNVPSGCSIDSSTKWFKDLGSSLNIDFFDRSIAYKSNGSISTFPLFEGKKYIQLGVISPETEIFNNNLTQLSELENSWIIAAKHSHLNRHFEVNAV